jgi:tetratricopeptide (TPR) repeat protein
MHANVADAIELVYPDAVNERAGEIADHLIKAGSFADERKLVRNLTLAGNNALEAAAFEEARSSFRTAVSHQAAIGAKERAELLARLGMVEAGLELWDTALPNLRKSLEVYIGLGDRDMIGRSFSELTDALILAGRFPDAIETARRGLAHLGREVSVDRVRLLDGLSQALASVESHAPAHKAHKKPLELASRPVGPKLVARAVGA